MKMLEMIKERVSGTYKLEQKRRLEIQLNKLIKILVSGERGERRDKKILDFLNIYINLKRKELKSLKIRRFLGNPLIKSILGETRELDIDHLRSVFEDRGKFYIKEAVLQIPLNRMDEKLFMVEFSDLLLPYIVDGYGVQLEEEFYNEGPYEIDKNVSLCKGDIVVDCGANMGLFSAVASAKGCKVFAFEPMQYIIDNYLGGISEWNKNILICPFALSDKIEEIFFTLDESNIGMSKQDGSIRGNGQKVKAITLDSFVKRNSIEKIDFIKADIEGAERKMLLGARETIRRFSPKISICTYHLADDPIVLKNILLNIQPEYKIIERYQKMYAYVE